MTNEQYWARRMAELEEKWNKKSRQELETELAAYYRQALAHIQKDIDALYARFADDNGLTYVEASQLLQGSEYRVWRMDIEDYLKQYKDTGDKAILQELNVLAMRSRITRLDKLYTETMVHLADLTKKAEDAIDKYFPTVYQDFYYHGLYDIGQKIGLRAAVTAVDDKRVLSILKTPWSGKNYSQRIWKDNAQLGKTIKDVVTQATHRGTDIETLSRLVSRRMDVGVSNARRLVRTELNFTENRAAFDSIKEAGMKYYRFSATLDRRTSATCRNHDGHVYSIDEYQPGSTAPPLHPNCRSTIAGSLYGPGKAKTGTRIARNDKGKTYYVPADMTYEEWYQQHVNTISVQNFKKVVLSDEEEIVKRTGKDLAFRQITTQPNLHIANGITLKPKQMHTLQKRIANAAKVIGVANSSLPNFYIANELQLGTNSPAMYNWKQNRIFITLALLDEEKMMTLQKDGVLPDNPLSTIVHELIHWKDAERYRTLHYTMDGYMDWVIRKCKEKVVELQKRRYNINVSNYAQEMLVQQRFDEVYTEIRTLKLLEDR